MRFYGGYCRLKPSPEGPRARLPQAGRRVRRAKRRQALQAERGRSIHKRVFRTGIPSTQSRGGRAGRHNARAPAPSQVLDRFRSRSLRGRQDAREERGAWARYNAFDKALRVDSRRIAEVRGAAGDVAGGG